VNPHTHSTSTCILRHLQGHKSNCDSVSATLTGRPRTKRGYCTTYKRTDRLTNLFNKGWRPGGDLAPRRDSRGLAPLRQACNWEPNLQKQRTTLISVPPQDPTPVGLHLGSTLQKRSTRGVPRFPLQANLEKYAKTLNKPKNPSCHTKAQRHSAGSRTLLTADTPQSHVLPTATHATLCDDVPAYGRKGSF
jgi:hypothetical protein